MSTCTTSRPLSACEILNQAIEAVHEAARGGSVMRIRVRDTDTQFQESSLESRVSYLKSLVMNSAVFGRCPNFSLAMAAAGIPMGRSPAYATFGRREFVDPGCGCGPAPVNKGGDCCE